MPLYFGLKVIFQEAAYSFRVDLPDVLIYGLRDEFGRKSEEIAYDIMKCGLSKLNHAIRPEIDSIVTKAIDQVVEKMLPQNPRKKRIQENLLQALEQEGVPYTQAQEIMATLPETLLLE